MRERTDQGLAAENSGKAQRGEGHEHKRGIQTAQTPHIKRAGGMRHAFATAHQDAAGRQVARNDEEELDPDESP